MWNKLFKNPMLKAKFIDFVDKYELNGNPELNNIRKFICYTYISQVQPERLNRDFDLLDDICDKRLFEFGIWGLAIALNSQLLTTKTDIDDILQNGCKAKFDIYLITDKIDTDYEKVLAKIIHEKKEFEFIETLQYIVSQKIIMKWEELPTMNLVIVSDKAKEPVVIRKDSVIEKKYQLNEDRLFRIAKANDNDYSLTLEYTDGITLSPQNGAGQTYVTLCNAQQIVDILTNEDGMIRSNMFDANVRAYQGNTDVNNEMLKTLQSCPENFVLYNNGITIVCNQLIPKGKTLTISNPQIVNGCQTCNSLYKANADGIDISKAKVIVKTIEAIGESVAQGIVRGTNRQNIVYEEAFETIRQFHKDFEDFVNIMEVPKLDKVVINMGVGEAKDNAKLLDSAIADLEKITGQKAVVCRARKSVANFKLREGMAIGCKVTLRGEKMYEFVDRLVNLALPRVRDFRGVNPNAFDGRGNYALGIKEQLIFPEIEYDKVDKVRGMDIIFVTTANTDEEARELLTQFNMPFTK